MSFPVFSLGGVWTRGGGPSLTTTDKPYTPGGPKEYGDVRVTRV